MSGEVITGSVTVSLAGNPSITTTTTDGNFSLAGVPCSTTVALKMSSSGYLDVYTQNFSSSSSFNISANDAYGGSSSFRMPKSAELTAMGLTLEAGKALLIGRVVDNTYRYSSNVAGAVVTATGGSKTYSVTYMGFYGLGGSSTYQNGNFYVLNVDAADTVVLQASKTGWSFSPATFSTVADSVGHTMLKGVAPANDLSVSGSVNDSSGLIYGAGIKLHNDGGKNTTANDGTFSLGSLPMDATFYLKVEDLATPGAHVPTYVGPITLRESLSHAYFWMYAPAQMTSMGVTGGNGLVKGKVVDTTGTPISGATVNVASRNGASYTVSYYGGGSSTPAVNGIFTVPNVQPGDVVRIDVIRAGYDFAPVYMDCFGDAMTERNIYGTVKSDFNADGKPDLIWQNTTTGQVYYWLMDGLNISSSGYLYNGNPVGLAWQIAGVGDMNSDGKPDLIWRNTSTGQVYYWLMDGLNLSSSGYLYDGNPVGLEWQVAGVGDMNSDGKSDLIWCNTSTGTLYYWLMDGLTLSSSGYLYDSNPVGLEWQVAGVGDMNSDGKSDLIWRNTSTGTLYYWLMDGLNLSSSGYLYDGNPVGLQWQIAGVADMNSDSKPDLIWRNTSTGQLYYWLMNGLTLSSSGYLYDGNPVGLDWQLRFK
jgi:hypothetical protein